MYRDIKNGVVGGVCSGLSKYYNIDRTMLRVVLFLSFLFMTGLTLFAYAGLWLFLKTEEQHQEESKGGQKWASGFSIENGIKNIQNDFALIAGGIYQLEKIVKNLVAKIKAKSNNQNN
jgi:phage shock protein C